MYSFFEDKTGIINEFSSINKEGHVFQTTHWINFKNDWNNVSFCGKDKDGNVVLTCCLLIREIPYINKKIGYIPRGFVCDYSNKKLVEDFLKFLKSYSKKNKISFITMDPEINATVNEISDKFGEEIEDMFIKLGLKNLSKGSKNFETIQPCFTFKLDISKNENEDIESTKKRVHKGFDNKCRYKIKVGSERALSVEVYDKNTIKEEHFDIFQNLMDITGERDKFIVRKKDYFKGLINELYPHSEMYLVKYNLAKDRENSIAKIAQLSNQKKPLDEKLLKFREELCDLNLSDIADESVAKRIKKLESKISTSQNKLDTLNTQLNSLTARVEKLNQYEDVEDIYLSGAIYLQFGDKGWYLYGASSNDFRDTMPNFTMQWAMIQRSIDLGKNIYDFWGAPGDTSEENHLHGLYKFKKSFGGDFIEFIGEYDLVIDNATYVLFKKAFPAFKKVRGKISRK